jgi:hypothetical protein
VEQVLRQGRHAAAKQTNSARLRLHRCRTRLQHAALLPGAGPALWMSPFVGMHMDHEEVQRYVSQLRVFVQRA